jgi:hypothetical protein
MTLEQLKSRAYDLIAANEQITRELQNTNKLIIEEQQRLEKEKKQPTVSEPVEGEIIPKDK